MTKLQVFKQFCYVLAILPLSDNKVRQARNAREAIRIFLNSEVRLFWITMSHSKPNHVIFKCQRHRILGHTLK